MWAKKDSSNPPASRKAEARQQKAAPLTQNTSRSSSYCPSSHSIRFRIRPRQKG